MSTSVVNVRMDSDLKHDFEETCKGFGLNVSSVIVMFATTVVREERIPFEISVRPKRLTRGRKEEFFSSINLKSKAGIAVSPDENGIDSLIMEKYS